MDRKTECPLATHAGNYDWLSPTRLSRRRRLVVVVMRVSEWLNAAALHHCPCRFRGDRDARNPPQMSPPSTVDPLSTSTHNQRGIHLDENRGLNGRFLRNVRST